MCSSDLKPNLLLANMEDRDPDTTFELLAREGDSKHILYPPMGCCHFQVDHQSTSVMSNARKASKDHEYLGVTLPLQFDRASPR